jgi:hypothetical protein
MTELDRCPHCARPALWFPNVQDATQQLTALRDRYEAVVKEAESTDRACILETIESRLAQTVACKALPRWELDRMTNADGAVAPTYYQQIRGQCRLPDDNRWDRLRRLADAAFFRSYSEKVHFAALSTGRRWLSHYGDGAVFFKDEMIAHRSTVFEKNTACWADEQNGKLDIPPGHSSTWENRGMLGAVKLADAVSSVNEDEIDSHILRCETTGAEDVFIEVHIYGSFTIRSIGAIVVNQNALSELSRAAMSERAAELGIDFIVEVTP